MKRYLALLLLPVLVLALFAFPQEAQAASGIVTHKMTWHFNSSTGTLTFKGEGKMPDFSTEHDSIRTWKGIMSQVKTIRIGEGITYIGDYAFCGGKNLTSVQFPESVTGMGDHVFEKCEKLETIALPNTLTSLGKNLFHKCYGLKTIDLPDALTEIGEYAFWDCTALASIEIPDTVLTVGKGAFKNCKSLSSVSFYEAGMTAEVAQQMQWRKLDKEAFAQCESLSDIQLSPWMNQIADDVFRNCNSLTEVVIPEGVTDLNGCFMECKNLKQVTLPHSLSSMSGTFAYCTGLEQIELPQNLTYIYGAFEGCTGLTSIVLPDAIQVLGAETFLGCENLSQIVLPKGLLEIGQKAFYQCRSLESITLPETIAVIDNQAFAYTGLVELTIPASLKTLGTYTEVAIPGIFAYCGDLKAIYFLGAAPSIDGDAFREIFYADPENERKVTMYYPGTEVSWKLALDNAEQTPWIYRHVTCTPYCYDGHNFSDWQEVEPATEQKEGLSRRICMGCGLREEKPIDMLPPQPTEPVTGTQQPNGSVVWLIIAICAAAVLGGGSLLIIRTLKRNKL